MREVDLEESELSKANLTGSHLMRANLMEAVLVEANLSRTNLMGVNLMGARVKGATLAEAKCYRTAFNDIDLSSIKGLDSVVHSGPSTIDIATLYRSKGKIPDVFLRGCGVPEDFIELTRGMYDKVIDFFSCFISYSRADKAFARRLHDTLQGRGIRCWLDEKNIVAGERFRDSIAEGIRYYDKLILICSKTSLSESRWVEEEIENVMQKESDWRQERDKRLRELEAAGETVEQVREPLFLIPITVDDYVFKGYQGSFRAQIKSRDIVSFRGWDETGGNEVFTQGVERVVRALRTDGGKLPPPPAKTSMDDFIK